MKKQIIVINGSGGAGKDTFVNLVSKYVPTMNYSSIDRIKEIAKECGWNGKKTEKDRKFLSDLKILCSKYNDLPMLCMRKNVQKFYNSKNELLFLHIREPIEISNAVILFNAKTLLIKRNSVKHITTNEADAGVFNYNYNYVIENNGTKEELDNKAKEFVETLSKL